jgi:colanic acid biosynthesis glycosyl transferase WcaI
MRILVLGLNYAPEEIGIGPYTTGLSQGLVQAGHMVQVVAGHPYYPQWQVLADYGGRWRRTSESGVTVTRCPHYVPAVPSGTKRLIHHASFAVSAAGPMLAATLRFRPDIIFTVAPSLASAPLALAVAKLTKAVSWLHIQDFEVEAALATGLLRQGTMLAATASRVETRLLRSFDRVSSISPEMCAKLERTGVDAKRVVEFRNWADTDSIRPLTGVSPYRQEWGISTQHVALYSGNIANKQGIELVVEAASKLRHRNDLTFVVCGQGPNRPRIEAQARQERLNNIRFYDLQPRERLGDLLGLATVHLLPQLADAADLVLPSKLANMLASGRPVLATAMPNTGIAREIEGCGRIVPPEDTAAFAAAIEQMIDDQAAGGQLGILARCRAENVWNRDAILQRLITGFSAARLAKDAV